MQVITLKIVVPTRAATAMAADFLASVPSHKNLMDTLDNARHAIRPVSFHLLPMAAKCYGVVTIDDEDESS